MVDGSQGGLIMHGIRLREAQLRGKEHNNQHAGNIKRGNTQQ